MLNLICHHIPLWKKIWLPIKENLAHYQHPPTLPPPSFSQWDSYKNDCATYHICNFREYISASSSSYKTLDHWLLNLTTLLESPGKLKTNKLTNRYLGLTLKDFHFIGMMQFGHQDFDSFPGDFNMQKSLRIAIQHEDFSSSSHTCPSQLLSHLLFQFSHFFFNFYLF